MNNWTIIKFLYVSQWLLTGTYCENYCRNKETVVDICQDDSAKETNIVYLNSGGAPKYQIITDCKCLIKRMINGQLNINVLDRSNLTPDMKFTINGEQSTLRASAGGTEIELSFSKENKTSVGGACVKIKEDNDNAKFSIHCEAKKIEDANGSSALSSDEDPDDDTNITLIASVVGGVVLVAVAVVVVVIILRRRRRNRNDPDNLSTQRNSNKTKEYEDTMDNYGMKPNPSYEQYEGKNKTGTDHVYEDQYAVPDFQQPKDMNQPTGYEYVSCNPSTGGNTLSNKPGTVLTENTYDHTVTTSVGCKDITENEYNHLPPSVNENPELDNYNTLNDVKTDNNKLLAESEYNVLKLT